MKKYIWIPIVAGAVYFLRKGVALKQIAEQIQFRTTGVRLLSDTRGLTLRVFMEIQNPSTENVSISKISGSVLIGTDTVGFFDLPSVKLKAGLNPLTVDVKLDSMVLATLGFSNLVSIFTGGAKLPSVTINTNINIGFVSVSDSQTFKL
jgi:hypothetical protein